MLSIVIPSYNDPLLHKTIDGILANAKGEIEVIPVLDGYWTKIKADPRVHVVHLGKNRGMREAINAGVSVARGKYIMRTDEHCMYAPGWDVEITGSIRENQIMTAKRYYLDPKKWEIMDMPPVEYEKLVIQSTETGKKFTGYPAPRPDPTSGTIYETQAMQGSFWIMHKRWWEKVIVDLQTEGYGPHLQDSHEMVFKTWRAGGKLMVDSNTWFAHKHVSFPRTHNYGGPEAEAALKYSFETWEPYYRELKKAGKL